MEYLYKSVCKCGEKTVSFGDVSPKKEDLEYVCKWCGEKIILEYKNV